MTSILRQPPCQNPLRLSRQRYLPSQETIVALCNAARFDRTGIPLCNQPSGPIIAWVKYGPNVTMAEALTQDYVAKYLTADSVAGLRVPRSTRLSRETPPTFPSPSATLSWSILMPQIAARETTSVLQGLCRRLLASKVPAPRLDPSAADPSYTTFSWSGRQI